MAALLSFAGVPRVFGCAVFGGARLATSVTRGGFIRTGFAKAEFFAELAAGEIAVLLSLCGGRRASCVFAGLGALWVATFPGDGTRIRAYRDLYDESSVFSPVWSGWADSNCRSPAPKAGALPLGHTPTLRRFRVIRRRAATSRSRRRPGSVEQVPPRRLELRSLAPEASTLSTELQGHLKCYHSSGVSRQFIIATPGSFDCPLMSLRGAKRRGNLAHPEPVEGRQRDCHAALAMTLPIIE